MATTPLARLDRMVRFGRGATWGAFVVAVAIAGAGLTLALDHPQNDTGRPELTARGDGIVAPRLAALQPGLASLAAAGEDVAAHARDLYGHLRARNTGAARTDLSSGDLAATAVASSAISVKAAAGRLLDGTSLAALSAANRGRIAAVERALAAAADVPKAWGGIASASVLPISAVDALADHDAIVLAATGLARATDFRGALQRLGEARASLDRARTVTDQAVRVGRDAHTLLDWIVRSGNYDDALVGLYAILVQSDGVMNPEARAALRKVEEAEAALPTNTSALIVIVSELGGQQITLGLIELDRLRGEMAGAVDAEEVETPAPTRAATPAGTPLGLSPLQGVARR